MSHLKIFKYVFNVTFKNIQCDILKSVCMNSLQNVTLNIFKCDI